MKIRKPLILGLVAGVALSTVAVVTPAFADPVSSSYAMVGSDTLQDSANALTNGTKITGVSVRIKAAGSAIGNFDAFGSSTIQAKSAGPFFTRPSGSGAGVTALIASIKGATYNGVTITDQVDIARSSSGPGTNASATGKLAYVPYARDAVSYAYYGPSADLGSLTTAQLKSIYESNTPVTIGSTVVKPLIPQSGSGTRSFFLSTIGVTTLGSTVSSTFGGVDNTLPENNGTVLTQVGQIVPFSVASWVAQSNTAAPNTIPASGDVKLGSANSIAPFTGSGTSLVPNSAYYSTSYGRDTYLVVEFARIDPSDSKYDATLAALVNPGNTAGLTDFTTGPSRAGAVKVKFGFQAPSSQTILRAYATL